MMDRESHLGAKNIRGMVRASQKSTSFRNGYMDGSQRISKLRIEHFVRCVSRKLLLVCRGRGKKAGFDSVENDVMIVSGY